MNRLFCTVAKNVANNKQLLKRKNLPRLAVFDLDHTVWPFGIDGFQYIPPYFYHEGKLIDVHGQEIRHFSDFPHIFQLLRDKGIQIAVASRTKFPTGAYHLIELFDWQKYINYYQIYPGVKVKHFERIREESAINFNEMIFFDDEERNIIDVGQQLGVDAILVDHETGVTEKIVIESLENFVTKQNSS
ncbi:magnesium-dependent phosphatase 1-like protein [Euroglyphus maynei]|uniref:Magnesium-dependent phosphatase 1-like protein n=1 Tax=Euroglyphus maynei TaxID=6958 RepID=A0A1Y3BK42_EURMA|nr:magnesium-dependent phosphatase 1-like protein [Euroglyphus maynei]